MSTQKTCTQIFILASFIIIESWLQEILGGEEGRVNRVMKLFHVILQFEYITLCIFQSQCTVQKVNLNVCKFKMIM